jgi:hypothetical protein
LKKIKFFNRLFLFLIFFFLLFFSQPQSQAATKLKYQIPPGLKQGYLIFVSLNCFSCKLIQDTANSKYSHVAIITEDKDSGLLGAVMAVPPKVMEVNGLDYFYNNSLVEPLVLEMKSKGDRQLANRAAEAAKRYIGTPYDVDFVGAPKKLYCSMLISLSFKDVANGGKDMFPLVPMDFGIYREAWSRVLGHPAPQGFIGISPGDIERSEFLQPRR